MTSDKTVDCPKHGQSFATFVCEHLVQNPAQRWYCDYPEEEDAWPDAWCEQCENRFQEVGEWNESNEDAKAIKVLCNGCYEAGLATSLEFLEQRNYDSWRGYLDLCHNQLCEKQERLKSDFGVGKHKRWDYDQATGLLTFSNGGVPAVIADIDMIGSLSIKSETWLWAWANFHMLPKVRTRIEAVRVHGESSGFPRLTIPKWPADEALGWEVSAVSAQLLNAEAVYRVPSENGFLFMALSHIRHAH